MLQVRCYTFLVNEYGKFFAGYATIDFWRLGTDYIRAQHENYIKVQNG